jgi:hypothetical protein
MHLPYIVFNQTLCPSLFQIAFWPSSQDIPKKDGNKHRVKQNQPHSLPQENHAHKVNIKHCGGNHHVEEHRRINGNGLATNDATSRARGR